MFSSGIFFEALVGECGQSHVSLHVFLLLILLSIFTKMPFSLIPAVFIVGLDVQYHI